MRLKALGFSIVPLAGVALIASGLAYSASAAPSWPKPPPKPQPSNNRPQPTGRPQPAAKVSAAPKIKPLDWQTNYQNAVLQSQKQDKLLLMYFSGTGWDAWSEKLEEEVLDTPPFIEWAKKNVIPLRVDFPDAKVVKQSPTIKQQNEKLRVEYNMAKVPTFLFVDPAGDILARVGYDTAKLRDEESTGEPKAWIAFCDNVVKTRPPPDVLKPQKTLDDGIAAARKNGIPLLMLITHQPTEFVTKTRQQLLESQAFVRFVNRNMAFVELKWPDELDKGKEAQSIKAFAAKWKIGPGPLKLAVWDPGGLGTLKAQINTIVVNPIRPLLKQLENSLPKIDYAGGSWLENYRTAKAVSVQQQKDLFISFDSMDGSEWSQKFNEEVYKTPEFHKYAVDNLVLLRINFPKSAQQEPWLKEQNKMLADMYGVRGYPTIVMLNPVGQKIGDAKYMKGGVQTFLREVQALRKKDEERRILPSDRETGKAK
jgi:thioredoxin-related protein